MRANILAVFLLLFAFAGMAHTAEPKPQTIPFTNLGMNLPLNLVIPSDYVQEKRFLKMGLIVFCAKDDEVNIKNNGDFSGAKRAVITIQPSASSYYDVRRKIFSFESPQAMSQLKAMGVTNYQLIKKEVHGVPVAVMTFNVGTHRLYSLAIAVGETLVRVSYDARSEPKEVDDHVWANLIAGL
jgi:hypothetical protein